MSSLIDRIRIGTAGWTLPRDHAPRFPPEGSHQQRYAGRLRAVEVNSSFHRPHRRATWVRWAASTPAGFRFAVKMPKKITHEAKLRNAGGALLEFFEQVSGLNDGDEPKLGPILIQLPPKLAFEDGVAREFFATLRELHTATVAFEPRHASWFSSAADQLLREYGAARVAADPAAGSPAAALPGGSAELRYWRLHGAPRTYYSEYDETFLQSLAQQLRADAKSHPQSETWVIFDNTSLGHATANALRLTELLGG